MEEAYGFRDGELFDNASGATGFNMALMLERTQDPTALLSQPWSSRQQQLNELNKAGALWSTYGSDPGTFASTASQLQATPYGFTLWNSENRASPLYTSDSAEALTRSTSRGCDYHEKTQLQNMQTSVL